MKLNQKLTIAALTASILFAANYSARAQVQTPTPTIVTNRPHPMLNNPPRAGVANGLANQLGLSEDQKTKVRPILQDTSKQMAAVRQDTTLDLPAKRAKNKEIFDATTAQLKDILTADQLAKWQNMAPGMRRKPTAPGGGSDAGSGSTVNTNAAPPPPQQ